MKSNKRISLFLALLFLVSNVGLAINVHYCNNVIASISLKTSIKENNSCSSCCEKVEIKSHCCKDKVFSLEKKIDNEIEKTASFQLDYFFIPCLNQSISFLFLSNFISNKSISYSCDANAPPFYKLYNQYIFYDKF